MCVWRGRWRPWSTARWQMGPRCWRRSPRRSAGSNCVHVNCVHGWCGHRETSTADSAPASGGSYAGLQQRKRLQKVPLNTYVLPVTQQRMEWLKSRGYAVTDIVDAALNEFLDRAGAPRDDQA